MVVLDEKTNQVGDGMWIERPALEVGGQPYQRFVVRTHLVRPGERLAKTLTPYLRDRIAKDDIIVLGEKIVAIAEGRAVLVKSVRPRRFARFLSKRVRPLGYGMGLRRPETMEMAIREVGLGRILLASAAGALDRLVGRTGDFYRVAGRQVASIDGPGPTTIPPYDQYIVLAPADPQKVANQLAKNLGACVAVVDVNDIGCEVLATSPGVDKRRVEELLRDNPMGQGAQRTPVAILRLHTASKSRPQWPKGLPVENDAGSMNLVPGVGDESWIWAGDEIASTEETGEKR